MCQSLFFNKVAGLRHLWGISKLQNFMYDNVTSILARTSGLNFLFNKICHSFYEFCVLSCYFLLEIPVGQRESIDPIVGINLPSYVVTLYETQAEGMSAKSVSCFWLYLQKEVTGTRNKNSKNNKYLKCTLMQILKPANIFVFIWKLYVEDFTLKHLLIFEICAHEICEKFVSKYSEITEWVQN